MANIHISANKPDKRNIILTVIIAALLLTAVIGYSYAENVSTTDVSFPETIHAGGKTLKLNGVGKRKFLWHTVISAGLYLEHRTNDAGNVIESEQVKCLYNQFLVDKIPAQWVRKGVQRLFKKTNSSELCLKHKEELEQFALWYDSDVSRGETSIITYVPGVGLTLKYRGRVKGTIPGREFARMYFSCGFGHNADETAKKGFLGLQ
ncbi:MAG: chalcone isomerase family protein [Deltaproteobacteria bacterium]|nr:chalcone isomerase family protein [Deltaproteobacteria bacterium]